MHSSYCQCHKVSFTIIDIYESIHRVRFLMTPSPKAYYKMLIFFKVIIINSNMHRLRVGLLLNSMGLHHALIVSHLLVHMPNHKQNEYTFLFHVALHRSTLKKVQKCTLLARGCCNPRISRGIGLSIVPCVPYISGFIVEILYDIIIALDH